MATEGKIQIEVEVVGADKSIQKLDQIEKASVDLKEGVSGVGEGFKSVGDIVKAQGGMMGEAFGTLGDSVIAITESVVVFKDGMATAGATGAKAWLGLLGPIAMVVSAVAMAVDAFRQFSGATREAEMWEEAMSATASDLTSRMEALAETGLKPTTAELREFIKLNQQARFTLEILGLENEKLVKAYKNQNDALKAVSDAKEQLTLIEKKNATQIKITEQSFLDQVKALPSLISMLWGVEEATSSLHDNQIELEKANQKIIDSEKELARVYEEKVIPQLQKALRAQEIASKTQLQLDDDLYAKLKEIETAKVSALETEGKYSDALKVSGEAQRRLNDILDVRKKKEKELLDQLRNGILTQDKYDESLRKLKEDTYDQTKALDDEVRSAKKLQEQQDEAAKKQAIRDTISQKTFEVRQRAYDREVELINREKQEILDLATARSKMINESIIKQSHANVHAKVRSYYLLEEADLTKEITEHYKILDTMRDILPRESTNYENLNQSTKEFLDQLTLMNKNFREEASKNKVSFTGSIEDHLKLTELFVKENTRVLAETISEADLKVLNAQRDFQLKNRKQLKLSQEEILQDYEYQAKRIKDLSLKEAHDRMGAELEAELEYRHQLHEQVRESDRVLYIELEGALSDANKKKLIIQATNDQQTERARFDLNQKLNKIEKDSLEWRTYREKKYLEDLRADYKSEYEIRKLLIKEQYSVEGQLTIEGQKKKRDVELEYADKKLHLDKRDQLFQIQNAIVKEELLQKEKQQKLETLVFEKKYGEDRMTILQQFFLTEEQLRDQIQEDIIQREQETNLAKLQVIRKGLEETNNLYQGYADIINKTRGELLDLYMKPASSQKDERIKTLRDELYLEIDLYKEVGKEKEALTKQEFELNKKYNAKNMEDSHKRYNQVGQMLKDYADSSTQALISSGVAAAFAGENIGKALKQTLRGLAQEATAKSLLEGAYALGSLAVGDEKSASLHGLAALKFGAAAIAVGALSTIGGATSGNSASSGATSPLASNQATATEQRPEAKETQPIVYNINFGGSVIYDTREAALRAFSNEITQIQNRPSRGSQSSRIMNARG